MSAGSRRIKALGHFCHYDADVGVECRRCGRVRVFCDWEAEKCFRERGWATDLDAAARRLRCPCGSGEVKLIPVPIWKRPQPLPVRPAALRPIYAEDHRSLRRRGRVEHPDPIQVERALQILREAIGRFPERAVSDDVRGAAEALRPLVYHSGMLDELLKGLGAPEHHATRRQQVDHPFRGILRQLGRTAE